jgi:hypothetical protein
MDVTRRKLLKGLLWAPVAAVGATLAVKALTPPPLKMEVGTWEGFRFIIGTDPDHQPYVHNKTSHSFGTISEAEKRIWGEQVLKEGRDQNFFLRKDNPYG